MGSPSGAPVQPEAPVPHHCNRFLPPCPPFARILAVEDPARDDGPQPAGVQRWRHPGLEVEAIPVAEPERIVTARDHKSPVALRYIKDAVRASVRAPMDEGLQLERTLFGLVFASEDKAEGVEAFLQKRKPERRRRPLLRRSGDHVEDRPAH